MGQALADRFADREKPVDVEKQIYSGFYSAADKHILQRFEHVGWRHRAELISSLEDHRLRQLGQRLIYWNAPALVSEHYATAAQEAIRERWLGNDPDALWMTKAGVEKQLAEIDAAGALNQGQINALREFYQKRLSMLSA